MVHFMPFSNFEHINVQKFVFFNTYSISYIYTFLQLKNRIHTIPLNQFVLEQQ